MTIKTLEYFMGVAQEQGRGILWHQLRGHFPDMNMKKFQRLYKEVLSQSGIKGHSIDDYNILGV